MTLLKLHKINVSPCFIGNWIKFCSIVSTGLEFRNGKLQNRAKINLPRNSRHLTISLWNVLYVVTWITTDATKNLNFLTGIFNLFHATCLFLYPLKTLEKLWFSDIFVIFFFQNFSKNHSRSLDLEANLEICLFCERAFLWKSFHYKCLVRF